MITERQPEKAKIMSNSKEPKTSVDAASVDHIVMPPFDSDPPEAVFYYCANDNCREERSYKPYQIVWVPSWNDWYCEDCVSYDDSPETGIQLSKWLELRHKHRVVKQHFRICQRCCHSLDEAGTCPKRCEDGWLS